MVEPIDGITDPWECGNYLIEQMKDGFTHNGRFFIYNNGYQELKRDALELLILRILKEKATQAKISLVIDRLTYELPKYEPNEKYLAFEDGYLDPTTCKFVRGEYEKEARVYQRMPFKYDNIAQPTEWYAFLDQVFEGDEDAEQKKMLIQEYFGYCLMRDMNYHKALMLYGSGGNGKSVICDILEALVPYATHLEWTELGEQRGLERLADSWLNVSTEISYKENSASTGFKKVVAGETITANPKYKRPFDFKAHCKLIFASNGVPQTESDSGVFRRLIIIALNNSFVGREDWQLTNRLKEELPGIFNWAIVGAARLRGQGYFTYVPSNVTELQEYRRAINSLQSFHDEELNMYEGQEISFNEFYRSYTRYCLETSNRPFARNKVRGVVKLLNLKLDIYTGHANTRMVKALAPINWEDSDPFS